MPLADAIADLDELGLSYRPIAEENSTVRRDVVFRTDPVGRHDRRRRPDGDRSTTTRRQELQEVPNVEGQPLDEAVPPSAPPASRSASMTPEESDDDRRGLA